MPSSQCTSITCFHHAKYDSSLSSTYKENGTEFGAGFIEGFVSSDTFTIGDISIPGLLFGEVTNQPGFLYAFYMVIDRYIFTNHDSIGPMVF